MLRRPPKNPEATTPLPSLRPRPGRAFRQRWSYRVSLVGLCHEFLPWGASPDHYDHELVLFSVWGSAHNRRRLLYLLGTASLHWTCRICSKKHVVNSETVDYLLIGKGLSTKF